MLVSENRPEWLISDLAIMAAGCVTVPTYTTNTERDHQHILDDSGARAVIVSTQKLAKAAAPGRDPHARPASMSIGIEPLPAGQAGNVQFHDWTALIAAETADRRRLRGRAPTFRRDDLACIIYTSGTGGAPRGVMQHHGAILHNVEGCTALIAEDFGWGDEVFLSFLPASHAYEHTGGQLFPIGLGAPDLLFGRAGEARLQHRGGAADDHGRGAAAVRGAAPAHPQDRSRSRAG